MYIQVKVAVNPENRHLQAFKVEAMGIVGFYRRKDVNQ